MAQGTMKKTGWTEYNNVFTVASGYALYDGVQIVYEKDNLVWLLMSIIKSDQTAFAQTRHTVGTIKSDFLPKIGCNSPIGASTGINSFLNRNANLILAANGQVIVDCFSSNDIKQFSVVVMYVRKN